MLYQSLFIKKWEFAKTQSQLVETLLFLKFYFSFYLLFNNRVHREIIRVHGVLREILCVSVFRFIVGIHLQYLLFLAIFYFFQENVPQTKCTSQAKDKA